MDKGTKYLVAMLGFSGFLLAVGLFTLHQVSGMVDCSNVEGIVQNGVVNPDVIDPLGKVKQLSTVCEQSKDAGWNFLLVMPFMLLFFFRELITDTYKSWRKKN